MGKSVDYFEPDSGNRLLIGIDPGSVTGFCVLDIQYEPRDIKALYTMDFWSVYKMMEKLKDSLSNKCQIHVEQPSMIKSLYARHSQRLTELQSKIQTRDRIVWNSAENAREGMLLAKGLRDLGYTVFDCRPVGRRKWTSEQFQAVTGYQDRSNQHVRDAVFLVWDKPWQEVSQV